ncbi:MAG: GNAT family N-acetyltransferase, partial [Actinomycetes bacterium]
DEVVLDRDEVGRHLFGADPAAHVLIAEPATQPGTTAGMALWYRTFSTWVGQPGIWLEDLFVRPAFRHQGLAGELLAELAHLSDARVEWAVLDWNRDAMAFYDGLGARPVEGWTRYRWVPAAGGARHGH